MTAASSSPSALSLAESSAPGMRSTALRSGPGARGKLGSRGAKCGDVTAHNLAVERECLAARALQAQRYLDMPATHLFFQQAPKLHLEGIGTGGKTEM